MSEQEPTNRQIRDRAAELAVEVHGYRDAQTGTGAALDQALVDTAEALRRFLAG